MMRSPALQVLEAATILSALNLMSIHAVSGLAVVDSHKRLTGVIDEGNILRYVAMSYRAISWKQPLPFAASVGGGAERNVRVADVMTRDAIAIDENASLSEASALLQLPDIVCLPVLRSGHLVGMLTRSIIANAIRMMLVSASDAPAFSNEELERRIEDGISAQSLAGGSEIRVCVRDGAAVLSGRVRSDMHHRAIVALVEGVVPKAWIQDRLSITEHAFLRVVKVDQLPPQG